VADRVGIIRGGEMVAVEHPATLTNRAFRYVRIQFAKPIDVGERERFAAVAGVERFAANGRTVTFRAQGSMDEIVRLASHDRVEIFDVERPTLDEIFLSYYGEAAE